VVEKIIKRAAETATKAYFLNAVRQAYRHGSGRHHDRIKQEARIWFGLDHALNPLRKMLARWYVDFVLQARTELFQKGERDFILHDALIGFDDLCIHCTPTDSNTSFVYLLGFTDNMVSFDILEKYIPQGTVAVDVGANVGVHSLVLSRCVGDTGRVIAFEALNSIHDRLKENIRLNGLTNIETRPVGISDRKGTFRFDSRKPSFNIGKGRISDSGDQEIPVATLDDELRDVQGKISLLKIDIEGHELNALRGAQEILKKHRPVIMCKFNPESYSFSEFASAIPFKAKYFQIPTTMSGRLQEIDELFDRDEDVLVVPE
jgi:FkbM family methyltransferase